MNIIYSFNKKGRNAQHWHKEISAASTPEFTFIPFNHDPYLDLHLYARAQLLDNLYYAQHPGLMAMYGDFEKLIEKHNATAVIVDNCHPYHPDYLRKIPVYKVLRTSDGPLAAYDRDFAYLHAYHQVLYHSPAYSRDLDMAAKLRYCGQENADWWPLGVFDYMFDPTVTQESIMNGQPDIDVVYLGRLNRSKAPFLARIKKGLGRRLRLQGFWKMQHNLYFNLKYNFPGWVRPLPIGQELSFYRRAKVGFNLHNRGDYTVGSFRLFALPANGVMQISDGGSYLAQFFRVGEEIEGYENVDDLIDKIHYYLDHDEERRNIAVNGFKRVMRDYRFSYLLQRAGELIRTGMARIGWRT